MKNIDKYKDQLCIITKDPGFEKKKFAFGFTSAVYRLGSSVIKETYLSPEELQTENFFQEIKTNIYFREHPELEDYVVKFEGFEFCNDKIYTKYPYVGNNLSDTILDYSVKDLTMIKEEILHDIKILHNHVIHGDLHIGNIFISKDKNKAIKDILIGDWGKGVIKEEYFKNGGTVEGYEEMIQKDYEEFLESFIQRLEIAYFFKNVPTKKCLQLLEEKGKKKQFYSTLNFKMEFRKRRFPHRPKDFIEKLRPFFFNINLFNIIKKEYGEAFILEKCKFSKPMQEFISTLHI
jgi:serine/threonine protein kinase